MGLFGKLFGGGAATLETVRKAIKEKRFADASRLADEMDVESMSVSDREEVDQLRINAGDELARLNLGEALGLKNCGREAQAEEYFQLALEKVCSSTLKSEIEQAQESSVNLKADEPRSEAQSACASCSSGKLVEIDDYVAPEDVDLQMELILTSYPEALASRYLAKGKLFQEGFLLAQSGLDEEALKLWAQEDPDDQDDLYCFELGSLLGRVGELDKARQMLETALSMNSGMLLAVESLIPIMIAQNDFKGAEKKLRELLDQGIDSGFCHAQLAIVHYRQGATEQSAKEVQFALAAGVSDPSFQVFAAKVLESSGAIDEAEELLQKLPASGCKGGVNLPLAEFLLRQKRDLGKILDSFNAACREDPQDPRWQLRVAQTYMARNWKKDGIKLLKKVVNDPRLEPELAQEAKLLLNENLV
jgi:tetratricopeptide (TPR) repeat protein